MENILPSWLPINKPKGMITNACEHLNTGSRCWKKLGCPGCFFFSIHIVTGLFRWNNRKRSEVSRRLGNWKTWTTEKNGSPCLIQGNRENVHQ